MFTGFSPTKETTLESAEAELQNRVYDAALYCEELENLGLIDGNGHHAAQKIAEMAKQALRSQWRSKKGD